MKWMRLLNCDASFAQWTRAKGQPGFGPVIETSIDFATARLRTLVAGRERQNYALADRFLSPASACCSTTTATPRTTEPLRAPPRLRRASVARGFGRRKAGDHD